MADTKISGLSELAAQPAADDLAVIVDVSDTTMAATGTDKKIQYSNLMGGAWADWTPTFANLTKGSATVTAKYIQIGKTVHFRLLVQLAADSSVGTTPTFTLPVEAASDNYEFLLRCVDTGTASFMGRGSYSSTTTSSLRVFTVSGTQIILSNVTATVPHTWANTDEIRVSGTYESV